MAVITITATGHGNELIDGIPQRLVLETNVPSTIFYTLDGSDPTTSSSVYVGEIIMPTLSYVMVRVRAISGADKGYLEMVFQSDSSDLRVPRRPEATYGGGIVVDAYAGPNVLTDGYGADEYGNVNVPLRSSDYELQDLDIQFSRSGVSGIGMGTATTVTLGGPPRDKVISHDASSPNNNNVYFNPRSLYVVIDGRDGYQDQIYDDYQIINRPLVGTANPLTYMGGRMYRETAPVVTGGLVRTFYSAKNRLSVSYYWDILENRWIKSIQNFDPSTVPSNLGVRHSQGPAVVYKWVYNKVSSI